MAAEESPPAENGLSAQIRKPAAVLAQLTLVVLIASALTLARVEEAVTPPSVADNPTPLGYTWSLLLFMLPLAWMLLWFALHPQLKIQKKAFATTLMILLPLGFLLDLFFAHTFFVFENTGAVSGIEIPGVGGGIPIEEFVFYLSGFVFVLLLYVWSDEAWMDRYNLPHTSEEFQNVDKVFKFHWQSVVTALVLLGAAVIYKKFFSGDPEGFPLYWTYLLAAAFVPAAGFFRTVRRFINWRAFSFAFLLTLLISLMWEASLASPFGWWGYQADTMTGIFITAWSHLPVEAVFVWLVVTYTTVIIYEVVTVWQATGKSFREAMLGRGA